MPGCIYCNGLMAESNLGSWEPRGSTKSHHAEELLWEVYWGGVQRWPRNASRRKREWGKRGFFFSFFFFNKEV